MIKYFFLTIFVLMFLVTPLAFAENISSDSANQAAKKYGVSFPIEELGNCANLSECKTYCDDPLHQAECVDFAKKKGFFKEQKSALKNAITIAANKELGCDSENSCKKLCGEEANWQKCGDFAKKHNLGGGQTTDPSKTDILTKAKEVLGCGNYDSCKGFCAIDANKGKCDEFAKLVGLKGGVEKKGPGGCTSEETCKTFCSDPTNYKICVSYTSSIGGKFVGPGGCNSEASCKKFCQEHPNICGYHTQTASSSAAQKVTLQEMCIRTPNCAWKENSCLCGSSPTSSCIPRPSCLDTNPACLIAEPKGGWCSKSSSTTTCQVPSSGCGVYHYFDKTSCSCRSYEDYCKAKGGTWINNSCQLSKTTTATSSSATVVKDISY